MKKATKKKITGNKKEINKTGGGVANIQVLTDTEKLVETQIGKASLHGVSGVQSMTGKRPFQRNNEVLGPERSYTKWWKETVTQFVFVGCVYLYFAKDHGLWTNLNKIVIS